jgi:fluoroacetyl-CoA thioesterase
MKDSLTVGITNEMTHTVTKGMAPGHIPAVVLSTPSMVGLIEQCCLLATQPHLDEGEATVGTHVCVSHDAAVNEGEEFGVRCRLASVEKRRLTFDVEVDGPRGQVSRGTHQRAVISLARMGG